MLNIVLFGAPGSGKGTQASLLADKFSLIHLSTGDMLRQELAAGTELGKAANAHISKGELVPDEVVIGMISSRIDKHHTAKGFIFDGFPRTTAQAEALDKLLLSKGLKVGAMIALEVAEPELIDRLLKRGKESGRVDDQSMEIIHNRLNVYHQQTKPIAGYYHNQKKHHSIDGIGSIEEIFDRIHQCIKAL